MRKIHTLASLPALLAVVVSCADTSSGPSAPEAGGRPRFEGGGLLGSGMSRPDTTTDADSAATSGAASGETTAPCSGGGAEPCGHGAEPTGGTEAGGGLLGSGM